MRPMHEWSLAEASTAIRAGTSPVDLLEALLARIARFDARINAFIHLDIDGARAAAKVAEDEIRRHGPRGPLHGIPVGIKDIIDVMGLPMTCHSAILRDNVPREDAEVIRRLRAAGAIIIGKLSTLEFAMGGPSFDLPFPPARNPWNPAHHTGGSSSGSAAGLAAGFFPASLGSDTGGSIRNPAAACGIVGLKPTYGLVSRHGVFPCSQTLDHVGPMGRTVEDVAILLEAIAGHDPRDPGSAAKPLLTCRRDLGRGLRGVRVGFVRGFHESDHIADPQVSEALENAAKILALEGALVATVELLPLSHFASVQATILHSEAWSIHADWMRSRPQDYGQSSRRRFMIGAFISAEDLVAAQRTRMKLIAGVEDVMSRYDVLLCANAMDPAPKIDDAAELARTYPRQSRTPFNVTGHPAISMMSGLSKAGLPLSLQFVGRYFNEATLLSVAAAYERATSWHNVRPVLE